MKEGDAMSIEFELAGQRFTVINGGPAFKLTEAVSLLINCETQEEIDMYWERLSEGGEKSQCGWLKDKYGLSWQVVPIGFEELIRNATPEQLERTMAAMFKMQKLDMAELKRAYDGQ